VLTVLFSTVWLAADIRFPLMVLLGTAGGMAASRFASAEPLPQTAVLRQRLSLQLVPGHPRIQTN